jgi:hypothetical protein
MDYYHFRLSRCQTSKEDGDTPPNDYLKLILKCLARSSFALCATSYIQILPSIYNNRKEKRLQNIFLGLIYEIDKRARMSCTTGFDNKATVLLNKK